MLQSSERVVRLRIRVASPCARREIRLFHRPGSYPARKTPNMNPCGVPGSRRMIERERCVGEASADAVRSRSVGGAGDESQPDVILVEFGSLSREQLCKIDCHPLRALGALEPKAPRGGTVVAFWLAPGRRPDDLLDEVRGWSLGNGLPYRGQLGS